MGDGLQLADDVPQTISSHLDELLARSGFILLSVTIFSIIWAFFIDDVLSYYLSLLSPCPVEECMTVYAPSEWMAMRWMTVLLIAVLCSVPLISQQAHAFSRRGFLPSERGWLASWMLVGGLTAFAAIIVTMFLLLPALMSWAHVNGVQEGIVPAYDAIELLRIAFAFVAVETLILLAMMASLLAGFTGLLDAGSAGWFRLRIHFITTCLVWLSVPPHLVGLRLMAILLSIVMVEICIQPFTRRSTSLRNLPQGRGVLDDEGGLRRIMLNSCACAGACGVDFTNLVPDCMAASTAEGLCLSPAERDGLLQMLKFQRITDLVITGCDGGPLPEHMHNSLDALGIRLRGLSLLDSAAARPEGTPTEIDFQFALASLVDPWPVESVEKRRLEIGFDGEVIEAPSLPFGTVLQNHQVFASNSQ